MDQELEYFKEKMKEVRGTDKTLYLAAVCEMSVSGYKSVENCGNPRLLTLLKISKGLDIKFIIDNGEIEIL